MKICPHCQNTYTDDTLKYCLQDGKTLELVDDEKTEVFNLESFANEMTVAENYSDKTQSLISETVENENPKTNVSEQESNLKAIHIGQPDETLINPQNSGQNSTIDKITPGKSRGLGLVAGFAIATILIGLIVVAAGLVIYLPEMLSGSSVENSGVAKERTISDSDEVKVSASSSRKPESGNYYDPKLAFDGNSRTAWCEGAVGIGRDQWIVFDFKKELTLKKIVIEPGYFKTDELWQKNNRLKTATLKFSDGTIKSVTFRDDKKEQTINTEDVKTKSVMLTIKEVYEGITDSKDTLISEVKFIVE